MSIIDLRSDTLTHPTQAMRKAMAEAEVGDDVFSEDPTVNRLEKIAAEQIGKEAALFVPSGTMGNLISMLSHCARGDEVILGNQSHIFLNEVGGLAALGGIHPHIIPNEPNGTLDLETVEKMGGIAFPLSHNLNYVKPYTNIIDGLIITGGNFSISPKLYGEKTTKFSKNQKINRTNFEYNICKESLKKNIPIIGICGGEQLINVFFWRNTYSTYTYLSL